MSGLLFHFAAIDLWSVAGLESNMAIAPGLEKVVSESVTMCHCGRPLHYTNPAVETYVRSMVQHFGECVTIHSDHGRAWLVPRHYLALHGLAAVDLPHLGFREVTGLRYWLSPDGTAITCGRCSRTSHNEHDVKERYCGNCHESLEK